MANTQTVKYNDLSAPFHRADYSVEQVYSNGTLSAQRYTITIAGVVTADSDAPELTLQAALNRMRAAWLTPRKKMLVQWTPDGESTEKMFEFTPPEIEGETSDIEWGPLPLSLDIRNVTGGLAAEYTYKVLATVRENWLSPTDENAAYRGVNPITALEKSWSFAIDADGFQTRTVSGRMTVAREAINGGAIGRGVSYYRDSVIPPLPDGFHRDRQDWTVDASGLSATFTIVDREYGDVLPAPITSGDSSITSSNDLRGGKVRFTLSGRFGAPKNISKARILQAIYSLLSSKVAQNAIIENRELTSDIYGRNEIGFRFQWWTPKIAPPGVAGSPSVGPLLTSPPNNGGKADYAGPYGTAGLTEAKIDGPFDPVTTTLTQMRQYNKYSFTVRPSGYMSSQSAGVVSGGAPGTVSDVSSQNNATPIIEFIQSRSFTVDSCVVPFFPKNGGKPIFQQTGVPRCYIIDAGLMRFAAKRYADGPKIPDPPAGTQLVRPASVEVGAPSPIGDGEYSEFKVSWKYVSLRTGTIDSTSFVALEVRVPADIRRQSGTEETINKGPAIVSLL